MPGVQHNGKQDIFVARQLFHKIVALKHKAEPPAAQDGKLVVVVLVKVVFPVIGRPLGGLIQPAQQVQQCGFSTAAGAGNRGEAPGSQGKAYIVQGKNRSFACLVDFTVKPSPGRASKRADYPYVG